MKETMCVENIGATTNMGYKIPNGVPVRTINAAINNNPSVTALTDEQIEELSNVNEGAYGPGGEGQDTLYQLVFVGKISLDTICYAILRPCRCVKSHNGDEVILKTAMFSGMNTITRLINRLLSDEVRIVEVYRIENGNKSLIARFNTMDTLVSFIQEDRLNNHPAIDEVEDDINENSNDKCCKESDYLKKIQKLESELENNKALIDSLREENASLHSKINKIKELIE